MNDFQQHTGFTVVSGGQTGVDIAALRAAQCLGFKTGGYAARGFKTQAGYQLGLSPNFGLQEHTGGYSARTRANVDLSDATLVIAADMESPGTKLTLEAARIFGRPLHAIQVQRATNPAVKPVFPFEPIQSAQIQAARDWILGLIEPAIEKHGFFKLNVAGNATSSAPGIFVPAFLGIMQVLYGVQLEVNKQNGFTTDDRVTWMANKMADLNIAQALTDNFNSYPDLNPRHQGLLIVDMA